MSPISPTTSTAVQLNSTSKPSAYQIFLTQERTLSRVTSQIAAFERTWYRANTELRRARQQAETDTDHALERYIDSLGAPSRAELASFPPSANSGLPDAKPAPNSSRDWPLTDENTGRPLYFVG